MDARKEILTQKIGVTHIGRHGELTPLEKAARDLEKLIPGSTKTPGLLQVLIEGEQPSKKKKP